MSPQTPPLVDDSHAPAAPNTASSTRPSWSQQNHPADRSHCSSPSRIRSSDGSEWIFAGSEPEWCDLVKSTAPQHLLDTDPRIWNPDGKYSEDTLLYVSEVSNPTTRLLSTNEGGEVRLLFEHAVPIMQARYSRWVASENLFTGPRAAGRDLSVNTVRGELAELVKDLHQRSIDISDNPDLWGQGRRLDDAHRAFHEWAPCPDVNELFKRTMGCEMEDYVDALRSLKAEMTVRDEQ